MATPTTFIVGASIARPPSPLLFALTRRVAADLQKAHQKHAERAARHHAEHEKKDQTHIAPPRSFAFIVRCFGSFYAAAPKIGRHALQSGGVCAILIL